MDLAKHLLRTTGRAFYTTEEVLVVDALAIHSTLTDVDLAYCLGMQKKELRKLCGRLKDHGLVSVQTRAEKKEDAPPPPPGGYTGRYAERQFIKHQDWYWLHFHPAIDAIKYRLSKLSKWIDSKGAPTTEKKDLECPRCKSQYTDLEAMDSLDMNGSFHCHLCDAVLDPIDEELVKGENESKKRLNTQVATIEALLREIDGTNVPENDFDTALSNHLPINRGDAHPGGRTTIAEEAKPSLASSKGLTIIPEKVSVSVLEDNEIIKPDPEAARLKREKEAKQNMLPDWISKSTISGDVTALGAKEARERREREAHAGGLDDEAAEDKKNNGTPAGDGDDAVMDDYWKLLAQEQARERRDTDDDDDDEDDEDEDEFEDVEPVSNVPGIKVEAPSTEEPFAKRVKAEEEPEAAPVSSVPAAAPSAAAESDEDDDMEFEDV